MVASMLMAGVPLWLQLVWCIQPMLDGSVAILIASDNDQLRVDCQKCLELHTDFETLLPAAKRTIKNMKQPARACQKHISCQCANSIAAASQESS